MALFVAWGRTQGNQERMACTEVHLCREGPEYCSLLLQLLTHLVCGVSLHANRETYACWPLLGPQHHGSIAMSCFVGPGVSRSLKETVLSRLLPRCMFDGLLGTGEY